MVELIRSGREGEETAVELIQGQLLVEVLMVAIQASGPTGAHAQAHRRSDQVGQGIEFSNYRILKNELAKVLESVRYRMSLRFWKDCQNMIFTIISNKKSKDEGWTRRNREIETTQLHCQNSDSYRHHIS
jgi:hypothetical protein